MPPLVSLRAAPLRRGAALAVLALVACPACGDNRVAKGPTLATAPDLIVVAHPADELLLMQPDVLDLVRGKAGLTVVTLATPTSDEHTALLAGYASAVPPAEASTAPDAAAWDCGTLAIADAQTEHCRLASASISLVFMPAPTDDALLELVRETDPVRVRTQEITGTHGHDDDARLTAGRLTAHTLAVAGSQAELLAYRGANVTSEPANKVPAITDAATAMLADLPLDTARRDLLARRYAVGFRRSGGGRLRSGNECLSETLDLVSCGAGAIWTLDSAGELRTGQTCLAADAGDALSIAPCLGGVERRWFVDDEGHVMTGQHASCLVPGNATVGLVPCETATATWELVPDTVSTTQAALGLTATGRAVRLGDLTGDGKADLCTIDDTGLICLPGDGTGGFFAATRIDDPSFPLAITPKSLTLGDVDGDGRLDACGRSATGILCATAASHFVVSPWTPAFADALATATTDASLTAVDTDGNGRAELCGVATDGLVCAKQNAGVFDARVQSTWPGPDATVWFAELDGDGAADWCTATDDGPACAVVAERALTTDGTPWGYASGGVVDVLAATTATVAFGDIDHDGRADVCTLRDDRVVCARSQGLGFGPRRTTLAILPAQSVGSALWLGDLDGDGRADPCVDTGVQIICAVQR